MQYRFNQFQPLHTVYPIKPSATAAEQIRPGATTTPRKVPVTVIELEKFWFHGVKMRYRKPSIKTLLGVTKARRKIGKSTGIYSITKVLNKPQNVRRSLLRKAGYESEIMKFFRFIGRLFR